ncbi:MAG: DUF481 domain-containing protein, partial [Myxococcota bacterium]
PPVPPAAPAVGDLWGASPAMNLRVAPAPAPTAPTAPAVEHAGRETREVWNAAGQLVRRLVFEGGVLESETTFTYDAGGRPLEERTVGTGGLVVQAWTYNADGTVASHTVAADGRPTLAETFAYTDGKLTGRAVTTPDAGTSVTTTTYGPTGHAVLVETRAPDGTLLARTVSDREKAPPAPTKIDVSLIGGVATSSDVRTTSVTAGFDIARKPKAAVYETDPLELHAFGRYNRSSSQGELTNDQLEGGVGLDYNNLIGPVTAFLFTTVERNPVANLDVDLLVAPIGIKYDIVPDGLFTLDASFAPVWNFRSIAVAAGETCDARTLAEDGHCTFSKMRGSLRVRAAVGGKTVKLKDTLEFLPTLNPDGDFLAAIEDEAILRNTLTLDVKLTGHLTLQESVTFVRDPLLTAQADCAADPENLLCAGMSLQTGTTLALTYAF